MMAYNYLIVLVCQKKGAYKRAIDSYMIDLRFYLSEVLSC
jgi:hypothetical protein